MSELKRGIIVSCQAAEGESLHNLGLMKFFAKAALDGGAVGIRCAQEDVNNIKEYLGDIPIIGLVKRTYPDSKVYITPTKKEIDQLLETKCDVIALDATLRARPNHESLESLVKYIRSKKSDVLIMADIATIEEAVLAQSLGFDYIGTTLRGYTEDTREVKIPDIDFIKNLLETIKTSKVIVEGGIWEKGQVEKISSLNPFAIVIGTSITRPSDITKRFVNALHFPYND